jgi:acyl transferase domain-containing protein
LEAKLRFPLHRGGSDQGNPDAAGIRFVTGAEDWHSEGPRRASINSFSMTGTHVHLVVEEAPAPRSGDAGADWHVLPVSADSADGLSLQAAAYSAAIADMAEGSNADACFTAGAGRRHGQFRAAIVSNTGRGLIEGLSSLVTGGGCSDPNTTVIRGTLGAPIYGFPGRRQPTTETPPRRVDRIRCEEMAQAYLAGEPIA